MKNITIAVLTVLVLVPAVGLSVERTPQFARAGGNSDGGYSESQTDYKKRMHDRDQDKQRAGYYDGTYHHQSSEFKQGKYQFVESGKKAHSKKRRHR